MQLQEAVCNGMQLGSYADVQEWLVPHTLLSHYLLCHPVLSAGATIHCWAACGANKEMC